MTAIGVGFGVGLNARIAYCLGTDNIKLAEQAAVTGIVLSFIHGIVLMVICMMSMPWFLSLYTRNENVIEMGLAYANRAFLFSIIIMLSIALEKIFQAVGRMKVSMISML